MSLQRMGLPLTALSVAALLPAAAQAVDVTAGDWKLTVSGNVNAHYIYSECDEFGTPPVAGGLACIGSADQDNSSSISNGLLPAALAISAATTQGGYDIGVTFGFFPGISTNDGGRPNLGPILDTNTNTALGTVSIDMRQVFLTFGNDRMGTFKMGRDAGLFGYDAIINDMTIRGVGAGNGNYAAPANTSLGSIGLGYIYTDWLAQINYTTPDFSGLKFTIGIFDPLEPIMEGTPTPEGAPGFHGKVAYTWGENLYLSASFLWQDQEGQVEALSYNSRAFDIGGKYSIAGFEFLAYYYDGKGVGTTGLFLNGADALGNERDSDGFLAQVTYKLGDTMLGVNYGESNLDLADGEIVSNLVESNSKYTIGAYHNLTENLTLLAEFSDLESEAHNGNKVDSWNINIGAFLAF